MTRSAPGLFLALAFFAAGCVDDVSGLLRDDPGRAVDAGPDRPEPTVDAGEPTDAGDTPPPDAGCVPQSCLRQSVRCGYVDDGCGTTLDCGVCGTWTRMTEANAPEARRLQAVIFDGRGMIVWGGTTGRGPPSPVGARYVPAEDRWTAMSDQDAPPATLRACAARFGDRVLVWGGTLLDGSNALTNRGGLYDPVSDTWTLTPLEGAPSPRTSASCAVVGGDFVVYGGAGRGADPAAALDLQTWRWRPLSPPLTPPEFPDVAVTASGAYFGSGPWVRYDGEDRWATLPTAGAPRRRSSAGLAWTGEALYVFAGSAGGFDRLADLSRYDAARDAWTTLETIDPPSPRSPAVTAWTGTQLLTWGCKSSCRDGFHFDPETRRWRKMAYNPDLGGDSDAQAVWTGEELLIVGGYGPAGTRLYGWRYRP